LGLDNPTDDKKSQTDDKKKKLVFSRG